MSESREGNYRLVRVVGALWPLATVLMIGASGFYAEEVIAWMSELLWGAPPAVCAALLVVVILLEVFESTKRYVFEVDSAERTISFTRHFLWFIQYRSRVAKFSDIRHIDIHHTGEISTSALPSISEIMSPEGLPFGSRMYFNGLSPLSWLLDWMLIGMPYMGAGQLKILLKDGTEWLVLQSGGVDMIVAHANELKRLTGARLT